MPVTYEDISAQVADMFKKPMLDAIMANPVFSPPPVYKPTPAWKRAWWSARYYFGNNVPKAWRTLRGKDFD